MNNEYAKPRAVIELTNCSYDTDAPIIKYIELTSEINFEIGFKR